MMSMLTLLAKTRKHGRRPPFDLVQECQLSKNHCASVAEVNSGEGFVSRYDVIIRIIGLLDSERLRPITIPLAVLTQCRSVSDRGTVIRSESLH